MAWNDILNDPEFQSQTDEVKATVANNYFNRNIVTPEFQAQTSEIQDRVHANFLSTIKPQDTGLGIKPERTVLGTVKDVGIAALKGSIGLVQAGIGVADIPTGGRVGKALEIIGLRPEEAQQILSEEFSPAQKAAQKTVSEAEGFFPTVKAAVKSPSTIVQTVIESAPLMIGGAGIARGALAILPKLTPLVAAAFGEGAIAAGATAEQLRVENESGLLEIKDSLAALASGTITGALGVIGGKIAKRLGIADVDTLLARGGGEVTEKGVIRRVLEGGITEGIFEELPQSAQEQVWMNAAQGKPLLEGVEKQAAIGLLAGGVVGGGVQLVTGGVAPEVIPTPQDKAQELVDGIVSKGSLTPEQGEAILAGFSERVQPEMTTDDQAELFNSLLQETIAAEEAALPEAEIVPETTEERVAATTENIKTNVTQALDAIEPQTEIAAQVKDLLQEEVTKIVTKPVVIPEAEIVGEELVSPREQAYLDAAVNLGIDTQGKTAEQIINEVNFAIEEQGLTEAEILPEEIKPVREAPEEIPTAAIEPSLPEAAPPVIQEPTGAKPFDLVIQEKVAVLDDPNRQILEAIRAEVNAGEAGRRIVTETPEGETIGASEPSTFPEYFQNKGYKKKQTLVAIDKALEGKKLAPGQELLIQDLHEGYMRARPEQITELKKAFTGKQTIKASQLNKGDTFTSDQEVLTVRGVGKDGTVTLEDGTVSVVLEDETVEIDSGSLTKASQKEKLALEPTPAPEAVARAEEQITLPIDTGKAELPKTPLRGKQAERIELIDRPKEIAAEKAQVTIEEAIKEKPAIKEITEPFTLHNNADMRAGKPEPIGNVPAQTNRSHEGFIAQMSLDEFEKLAISRGIPIETENVEFLKQAFKEGEAVAPPFLTVDYDTKRKQFSVANHEGRTRVQALKELGYEGNIPVDVFVREYKGKRLTPEIKSAINTFIVSEDGKSEVQLKEKVTIEEVIEKKPVAKEFPTNRVRIGKSPQAHEILRELEATPLEVSLGERSFEIKNEKTGEVQTVTFEEMKPIKKRVVSEKARDKAKAKVKGKLGRLTSGVDPTLLADYAVIGAFHIESGLIKIGEWSRQMISEFGDGIKPFLTRIFKQAKTIVPEEAEVAKAREAIKAKAVPEVKPEKKVVPSRVEEFRKKFAENITEPPVEDILNLAAEEKKLPKKKFGDHRKYSEGEKAALSKIGVKPENESFSTKMNRIKENLGTKIRQKVVDQYASLKDLSEQGYILAILSNTSTGALEAAFRHGKLRLTKDGAITVDETGNGLAKILSPLGEELDDFLGWIAGNRAKSLKGQERERLFSDEDIKSLISLADGKMKDGTQRKPLYNKVLNNFNEFQRSMVDIAVQTGTINKAEAESWNKDFYVPFYRILEEDQGAKGPKTLDSLAGQTAVKRLKGADVPLNDMLQNILLNWNHLLNASLKNQAGVVNLEAAANVGAATQIEETDKGKNSVFVRKDGRKVWYDVNEPLILESITSLSYEGFNSRSMRVMRKFKRAFTIGVTASPEFRIANLIRDTVHSVAVGKTKYNMLDNVFGKGWSGTKKDSLIRARMLAGGGEIHFGHLYGTDPEGARLRIKTLKKGVILDSTKGYKKFKPLFSAAWDSWNEFGSRLENINRAALYQNRVKEVGELKANFEARDLLNFTNSGAASSVRFLTQVVPFLNARLQGLDKMGRSMADKDQRNQFAIVTGGVALASIALYLAYKDDDDFKEREQWDRDTYWWFKLPGSDIAYRIPKPFEVGSIGTMAERMVEQIVDDKVHGELFAERFTHMIAETFSFSVIPQAVQPVLDVYANKNPFTKRPIETLSMERLSPTERKKAWTSETAIGVSNAMDKVSWGKAVLSPVQVEFLIGGYLGWLGAAALGTVDQIFTRQIGNFPIEPARRIDDYPGIGRFVRSNPQRNTKYATLFYKQMNEMNTAYNDLTNFRKIGDPAKARELAKEKRGILRLRKYFNKVQRNLNKINQRLRLVQANKHLDAHEKRREIDLLTVRKNRLTRIAVERAELV